MRALYFDQFQKIPEVRNVTDPNPTPDSAVIEVKASGICRSDWHGWMGHDPDVQLPHVPGHELAGIIVELGTQVKKWKKGQRVTVPFSCGCGRCAQCASGNQQICDYYFQPGFTDWGSFAQFVRIRFADENLVSLPKDMKYVNAAILGCRFGTAYRALFDQAKLKPEEWLSIFGCGGVGLSALILAKARGAYVIAIDTQPNALILAKKLGADQTILADGVESTSYKIKLITHGGTHVSLDAVGHPDVVKEAVQSLQKRGKHLQVGLMTGYGHKVDVDMDLVISRELEIIGSHGIQAHKYKEMLSFILDNEISLDSLISKRVTLEEATDVLVRMGEDKQVGTAVITEF